MRIKGNSKPYDPIATKVSKHTHARLEALAKAKGTTIYEILQMVIDTLLRYMDDRHNLSEEMEKAMSIFEHMVGWADALNLADPIVNREISEAVYILQDADGKKKGCRAVLVEKPFCGVWQQTVNVQTIFDRLFNILLPEMYLKLYRLKVLNGYSSVVEVLNALADADAIAYLNDQYRKEFEDVGRSESGRQTEYGRRAKNYYHRTVDEVAKDQRIKFDDYDKDLAESEVNNDT